MEQEENNVPLTSAAASDTQEEEISFSKSAEVSPPFPSPDSDLSSTVAMESNGEDQPEDLPSGDKYELQVDRDAAIYICICSTFNSLSLIDFYRHLQNTEDESASSEVRTEDAGASETTDTSESP